MIRAKVLVAAGAPRHCSGGDTLLSPSAPRQVYWGGIGPAGAKAELLSLNLGLCAEAKLGSIRAKRITSNDDETTLFIGHIHLRTFVCNFITI